MDKPESGVGPKILQANPADPAANAEEQLPPYVGVSLADVVLVSAVEQLAAARATLLAAHVIGFDTESRPTFRKGEESTGPHLIQLASEQRVFLFQVGRAELPELLREVLESPTLLKVGFGLRDDLKRLQAKFGIRAANVLDLAVALRQQRRQDLGAKAAVAHFFGQRLQKSKRISTTNWALPRLSDAQLLYAANDAQVALRVYRRWRTQTCREAGADAANPPANPSSNQPNRGAAHDHA